MILLVRGSFESIAAGMVFAILMFYALTTLALFKLRRELVGDDTAFRIPGYPLLPEDVKKLVEPAISDSRSFRDLRP